MKSRKTHFFLMALLVLIIGLISIVIFMVQNIKVPTFSEYTDNPYFQDVPAIVSENAKIGKILDAGGDAFVLDIKQTTEEDYNNYVKLLKKAGYIKHSDNGKDRMEGYVMQSSHTKGNLTLTVSHAKLSKITYISVAENTPLSERLIYKNEYVEHNISGAKTKLYLVELLGHGNSYVIQLKNGNFIIFDGGKREDGKYLVDFLNSLAQKGKKPVVEGWFISHAHEDHFGAMEEIATKSNLVNQIVVEGIYFMEPSKEMQDLNSDRESMKYIKATHKLFKNQEGKQAGFYRPQFGQRYYFSDIHIDVCMTPEQFANERGLYTTDFNDTSIWLKASIEGQSFLCGGDGAHSGARMIMQTFDKAYCTVDFFSVLHHAVNVYDYFTDFVTAHTAIYTTWRFASNSYEDPNPNFSRVFENQRLQKTVKEMYHYGDGTVVFTFPYQPNSAETLPKNEWIYGYTQTHPMRDYNK